jgi:hypothetical protein
MQTPITSATLTTERSLRTLLNGVDFTTMDDDALQRQVLTAIIAGTRTHYTSP